MNSPIPFEHPDDELLIEFLTGQCTPEQAQQVARPSPVRPPVRQTVRQHHADFPLSGRAGCPGAFRRALRAGPGVGCLRRPDDRPAGPRDRAAPPGAVFHLQPQGTRGAGGVNLHRRRPCAAQPAPGSTDRAGAGLRRPGRADRHGANPLVQRPSRPVAGHGAGQRRLAARMPAPLRRNNSQNLWRLVVDGYAQPTLFQCPADGLRTWPWRPA